MPGTSLRASAAVQRSELSRVKRSQRWPHTEKLWGFREGGGKSQGKQGRPGPAAGRSEKSSGRPSSAAREPPTAFGCRARETPGSATTSRPTLPKKERPGSGAAASCRHASSRPCRLRTAVAPKCRMPLGFRRPGSCASNPPVRCAASPPARPAAETGCALLYQVLISNHRAVTSKRPFFRCITEKKFKPNHFARKTTRMTTFEGRTHGVINENFPCLVQLDVSRLLMQAAI